MVVWVMVERGSLHALAYTDMRTVIAGPPLSPPPLGDEPGSATRRSGAYRDGTSTDGQSNLQDATLKAAQKLTTILNP
jgi:hypothetical protein